MKKITLFSILAVLFAAMSFTSCNTDGDSGMNILTLEQQKSFQHAMAAGSYNNMTILYEKKNDANVKIRLTLFHHHAASACTATAP